MRGADTVCGLGRGEVDTLYGLLLDLGLERVRSGGWRIGVADTARVLSVREAALMERLVGAVFGGSYGGDTGARLA
jgi:hypothetical protein